MAQSVLVGDKVSDIQAAKAAGIGVSYLVASENSLTNPEQLADDIVEDLSECADRLGLAN
jgi:D-glycero-D-manno-heptose 1,7-bisphosphate phosphatase